MRRYIENLHAKEPHQKREFAVRAATVLTGIVFLVWASTLGVRLAPSDAAQSTIADANAASLVAATAGAAFQNQIQNFGQSVQPATVQNTDQSANGGSQGMYSASTTDTSNTTGNGGATVIGSPNNPATTLSQ